MFYILTAIVPFSNYEVEVLVLYMAFCMDNKFLEDCLMDGMRKFTLLRAKDGNISFGGFLL